LYPNGSPDATAVARGAEDDETLSDEVVEFCDEQGNVFTKSRNEQGNVFTATLLVIPGSSDSGPSEESTSWTESRFNGGGPRRVRLRDLRSYDLVYARNRQAPRVPRRRRSARTARGAASRSSGGSDDGPGSAEPPTLVAPRGYVLYEPPTTKRASIGVAFFVPRGRTPKCLHCGDPADCCTSCVVCCVRSSHMEWA